VAKSCSYHESANHPECSYKPRGDTRTIRVTSVQDRIFLDYFCRIGVNFGARDVVTFMKKCIKLLGFAFLFLFALLSTETAGNSAELSRWNYNVTDINGNPITLNTFINKVTVVTFSTKESRGTAMRLGQEIGQKFGHRPTYQSLNIPNTLNVPFWAKFIARKKVAGFAKKAVDEALQRQQTLGHHVTKEEVRKKIIFIHDKDGQIWQHLGVNRHSISSYVGVINKSGNLVYIAEAPVDMRELFQKLEEVFQK